MQGGINFEIAFSQGSFVCFTNLQQAAPFMTFITNFCLVEVEYWQPFKLKGGHHLIDKLPRCNLFYCTIGTGYLKSRFRIKGIFKIEIDQNQAISPVCVSANLFVPYKLQPYDTSFKCLIRKFQA